MSGDKQTCTVGYELREESQAPKIFHDNHSLVTNWRISGEWYIYYFCNNRVCPRDKKDTDTAIIIPIHVDYRMNDQVQTCTGMGYKYFYLPDWKY